MVELEQVAEDLLAVPLLHLAQVGEHLDGLGLDAAQRLGGGGLGGGGAPLAAGEFTDERFGRTAQGGVVRQLGLGEHGVGGAALAEPADRGRHRLPYEPVVFGRGLLEFVPDRAVLVLEGHHAPHVLLDGDGEGVGDAGELRVGGRGHGSQHVGGARALAEPFGHGGQGGAGEVGDLGGAAGGFGAQAACLGLALGGGGAGLADEAVVDEDGDGHARPSGQHHGQGPRGGAGRRQGERRATGGGGHHQHGRPCGERGARRPRRWVLAGRSRHWHGAVPRSVRAGEGGGRTTTAAGRGRDLPTEGDLPTTYGSC